jgi:hypothetical protein
MAVGVRPLVGSSRSRGSFGKRGRHGGQHGRLRSLSRALPNSHPSAQMEEVAASETLRRNCPPHVDVLLTHSCGMAQPETGLTRVVAHLAPR